MSNLFGGGARKTAEASAKKQQGEARVRTQDANEDAGRAQQRAERSGAGGREGRNRLMGNLGAQLKGKIGG
jgi:hypothetical protein